jgi:hypothetical protein
MKSAPRIRGKHNEFGWTMTELIVVVAVSALIMAGTIVLLQHTVMVGAEHRHKTVANLQVQYVGFWISEDVMQAQLLEIGQSPEVDGQFLTVIWTEPDGAHNEVLYEVAEMGDDGLWQLTRTHTIEVDEVEEDLGTSIVGEYLDPESTSCQKMEYKEEGEPKYLSSLILEVTADCGDGEATSTYEIHPRAHVEWLPLPA